MGVGQHGAFAFMLPTSLWFSATGHAKRSHSLRFSFNKTAYKQRHRIENAFCRLKDFRRIFTRYDRLARNFLASVCIAAAIVWWT